MSAVVVTGAAGFVGQRVVALLAGPGSTVERVVAVDHDAVVGPDHDAVVGPDHRPVVEGRVVDLARDLPERLGALLDGVDGVIHLAWSHDGPPRGLDGSVSGRGAPNLVALRQVLEAVGQAGVGRLVHVSSATVYGAWPDNPVPLGEDAALRPNPGFAFAVEKAEAERILAEWSDDHPDATITILRPTVTVGSSGPALYQALAGTRGPQPDDGGRPRQFLAVDDLASAIVFCWEHRLPGVYNVAPDGWISNDDARALVGGVARLTVPGRLARALAPLGWRVLGAGTPKEALPYSVHPWVVANDRLRAAGWIPQRSNEEALVASDDRSHWSDLPPSRRQEYALLAATAGTLGLMAGTAAAAAALVSRARARAGNPWRHRPGRANRRPGRPSEAGVSGPG